MKYIEFKIEKNIRSYDVLNNDLILVFNDKVFFNSVLLFEDNEYNVGYFANNYFVIFGNSKKIFKFNIASKDREQINQEWSYYWSTLNRNSVLISSNRRRLNNTERIADYHWFNLITKKLSSTLFTANPQVQILGNYGALVTSDNSLNFVSLSTGALIWQTDLANYCKYSLPDQEVQGIIRKVLGVYDEKLWVWTGNSQLLVLDINTGEVLSRHRIPDLDPTLANHGFLFPYFDEGKGVIAFLEHRFYIEFNLDTLQLSTLKSFDTGKLDTDWNFSINTFSDGYVYFTARRGPDRSSPSHLGVFNRQSMEVEWGQDLELWKTDPYCFLNQAPQYAAGKLYALDNKGTLHIFEREEVA